MPQPLQRSHRKRRISKFRAYFVFSCLFWNSSGVARNLAEVVCWTVTWNRTERIILGEASEAGRHGFPSRTQTRGAATPHHL